VIVSWQWCDEMIKYIREKYEIKNAPGFLQRRNSTDNYLSFSSSQQLKRRDTEANGTQKSSPRHSIFSFNPTQMEILDK
jgi:hypothetical protein